jgi:kumamolisin
MSPVDPERIELPRSERQAPEGTKHIARTPPEQAIRVSVMVRRRNPLDLAALGGRVLSREEFDAQYGADPADFATVARFAAEHWAAVCFRARSLTRSMEPIRQTLRRWRVLRLSMGWP